MLINICLDFKLKFQILEKNQLISKNKEIILVNFFGGLSNFYKYTTSVFIGKSTIKKLKDDSGQNPLDAARFGCKIYHGPYVYNFREIYNFLELRNELEKCGHKFISSNSDTETLLNGYKEWGEKVSLKLNGMWSFAIYDKIKNNIFISRDRFGEKPLHYIYEKELCISPIPSLAVHFTNINSIFGLSPNVDWQKIWDQNKY